MEWIVNIGYESNHPKYSPNVASPTKNNAKTETPNGRFTAQYRQTPTSV